MGSRYEVRLSGEGGQGLILAGIILAEAAAIYDEKNAIQTQSYGPEARGGACKSEVIISEDEIDYPKATRIDLLLALTQEACDKYIGELKKGGMLIVDSLSVEKVPQGDFRIFRLPILETARDQMGKLIVANIVALGAIVGLSGIVSRGAMEKALLARVPKGTEQLNSRALAAGFELAAATQKTESS
ncbi:MAG: 2-oxoacid:acceptor oxidoreductase family protein [candidate division NC10 bacterium]|nr:2-oxoacid:acceptor oxidoreductase family protein [candidate division NC10 bacterium]